MRDFDWTTCEKGLASLPELEDEYLSYERPGVLFRWALVNRIWYREAVLFLWEDLCFNGFETSLLPDCFSFPAPPRRQFYANFVQRADLSLVGKDTVDSDNAHIERVIFPRLQSLFLECLGHTGRT